MLDGDLRRLPDGGAVLTFDRRMDRPAEKVFAALTVAERIADWMGIAEIEPRVGGRYFVKFHPNEEYPEAAVSDVVTAYDPPRLFEHTWIENTQPESRVRWEITPDADGCRLKLIHTFPPGVRGLLGFLGGWHDFLDMIPKVANGERGHYDKPNWRVLDAGYREKYGETV